MSTKETKTAGIEPYVIDCMCFNFSEKEALSYLDDKGFKISAAEYYRLKRKIQDSSHERLNLIASKEFLTQHIERIDNLRTIHKELWANYHKETNPTKKANILMQIAELQQILVAFYDSTQYVMQQTARMKLDKDKKEVNNAQY